MDGQAMNPTIRTLYGAEQVGEQLRKWGLTDERRRASDAPQHAAHRLVRRGSVRAGAGDSGRRQRWRTAHPAAQRLLRYQQ